MFQENIVLVGDPFSKNKFNNELWSLLISMRKIDPDCKLFNLSKYEQNVKDLLYKITIEPHLINQLSRNINIFCVHPNQLQSACSLSKKAVANNSYNILLPLFEIDELSNEFINFFDYYNEIWTYSKSHHQLIKNLTSKPIFYAPFPGEVPINQFLNRPYFNLPENSFLFLACLDIHESLDRQNLSAILKAFQKAQLYDKDVKLVIKTNELKKNLEKLLCFSKIDIALKNRIIFIENNLSPNEEKNLIRNCDCFISLHRATNFGKMLAEAMYLSKPVIATGYSGNLDFMNNTNSLLVDYQLISTHNSHWADPNIDQAAEYISSLVFNPDFGRVIGKEACYYIRQQLSFRAAGLNYFNRIDAIQAQNNIS